MRFRAVLILLAAVIIFGGYEAANGRPPFLRSKGGPLPSAPSQTIASLAISCGSSCSVVSNQPSGTVLGTISVVMSPASPAFAGTLSLSTSADICTPTNGANNSSFTIDRRTSGLWTAAANLAAGTYTVCVLASQTGVAPKGLVVSITSTAAPADPTIGLLPSYDDAYANWKNAGLVTQGGISGVESSWTQCGATVTPSGIIPPASGDDASKINAAIAACTPNHFVLLNGAFNISISEEPINVPSSTVLRGSGTCNQVSIQGPSQTPICPTSITVYNGALYHPWSLTPPVTSGSACGVNSANLNPGGVNGCPNGGPPIVKLGNTNSPAWSGVAFAADAAQGATSVQLTSTSNFSVGMYVLINEASGAAWQTDPMAGAIFNNNIQHAQVWAAPELTNSSGSPAVARLQWSKFLDPNGTTQYGDLAGTFPYTPGSPGCWFSICDRPTAEIHKVTAVGTACPGTGCTLTFDDPLTIGYRASGGHNAQANYPIVGTGTAGDNMNQFSGIENMSLLRAPSGPLLIFYCRYCWAQNVELAQWYGGMSIQYSFRSELNTILAQTCWWCTNNGAEYPIDLGTASTEILVTNSITQFAGKGMVGRGGGAGSVVSYNSFDKTLYTESPADTWIEMSANASHYIGAHHVLFEGNWSVNMDNDNTHGNGGYLTYYRGWASGYRSQFTDPTTGTVLNDAGNSCCGKLRAVGPQAYWYWNSYVGNTLGTPGNVPGWIVQSPNGWGSTAIYISGWQDGLQGSTGTQADPYLTGTSGNYQFRHANYDAVSNAVTYDSGTPDHTLVNSFYLTSAPAFFTSPGAGCTYTWPWVTPQGGSTTINNSCGGSGLPAHARANAGTPLVNPLPPTVAAITLGGGTTGSYPSGAAAGSSVGAIGVTMSDLSSFDGTLAVTETDFRVSSTSLPSNMVTTSTTPTCSSSTPLTRHVVATPGTGETGSALSQALTITCSPAGTPLTAWDPAHKSSNLTLSTTNITNDTAKNTGTTTDSSVYSLNPKTETTIKLFFEYSCGLVGGGVGGGIANAAGRSDTYLGQTSNSAAFYNTTGSGAGLYWNNSFQGAGPACVNGDTVGIRLDTTASPITIAAAVRHSGAWGAYSTAYPLGSGLTSGVPLYTGVNLNTNGNQSVLCTNSGCAAGGTGDLPSGATWWDQAP